jgi:hypothetical protein
MRMKQAVSLVGVQITHHLRSGLPGKRLRKFILKRPSVSLKYR